MSFRRLDPAHILATARRLEQRAARRFAGRGLHKVSTEIVALTETTIAETAALIPPIWWLRLLIAAVVLAGAALFLSVGSVIPLNQIGRDSIRSVEGVEAAINTLVLAGLGLTALVRLEARVKRQRVALGLHGLRSIIHVIDMHQLTKDPVTLTVDYAPTAVSPERGLSAAELARYLDYCSELLAITGKLAALYAQAVPDDRVAQAVNDIEMLGSNLSRKIWQKIMMIETLSSPPAPSRSPRRKKTGTPD
ncbi:MAG: hypothetical protein HC844_16435 [Tabrizicola sp.]|nr:hypothetical protein [Tabrizicola sp.]